MLNKIYNTSQKKNIDLIAYIEYNKNTILLL